MYSSILERTTIITDCYSCQIIVKCLFTYTTVPIICDKKKLKSYQFIVTINELDFYFHLSANVADPSSYKYEHSLCSQLLELKLVFFMLWAFLRFQKQTS